MHRGRNRRRRKLCKRRFSLLLHARTAHFPRDTSQLTEPRQGGVPACLPSSRDRRRFPPALLSANDEFAGVGREPSYPGEY